MQQLPSDCATLFSQEVTCNQPASSLVGRKKNAIGITAARVCRTSAVTVFSL